MPRSPKPPPPTAPTIADWAEQITDDLLDVTSTAEKTGKAVGKDADAGKQTLVTLLGVDGARAEAQKRARRAVEALGPHAARSPELSALPFFLLDRDA